MEEESSGDGDCLRGPRWGLLLSPYRILEMGMSPFRILEIEMSDFRKVMHYVTNSKNPMYHVRT